MIQIGQLLHGNAYIMLWHVLRHMPAVHPDKAACMQFSQGMLHGPDVAFVNFKETYQTMHEYLSR